MSINTLKNIIDVLLPALLASKKAGDVILGVYGSDFAVEHKDDRSPVTLADRRSHRVLSDELPLLHGSPLPILSEEGKDFFYEDRKDWVYFWIVDPLDGTKEFVNRNGEFTVNIALIHKEKPVLGVIFIPVKETFYFAVKGLGAYKLVDNDIAINELSGKDLMQKSKRLYIAESRKTAFTIAGSRSHAAGELQVFVERMRSKYGKVELISAGSALKLCLVAEGRADIYPRFGPTKEWDIAAGQIIVEEAGGEVLDIETGNPLKYNKENLLNPNFVAGRPEDIKHLKKEGLL